MIRLLGRLVPVEGGAFEAAGDEHGTRRVPCQGCFWRQKSSKDTSGPERGRWGVQGIKLRSYAHSGRCCPPQSEYRILDLVRNVLASRFPCRVHEDCVGAGCDAGEVSEVAAEADDGCSWKIPGPILGQSRNDIGAY
jgi:hypothetical protein